MYNNNNLITQDYYKYSLYPEEYHINYVNHLTLIGEGKTVIEILDLPLPAEDSTLFTHFD